LIGHGRFSIKCNGGIADDLAPVAGSIAGVACVMIRIWRLDASGFVGTACLEKIRGSIMLISRIIGWVDSVNKKRQEKQLVPSGEKIFFFLFL
jgi:hypothetical protein